MINAPKALAAAVLMAGALLSPHLAFAEGGAHEDIERRIVEAKTAQDHAAIAAQYERQAQAARRKEAKHMKMKAAYAGTAVLAKKTSLVKHCQAIAETYGKMAAEYEALARLHREIEAKAR